MLETILQELLKKRMIAVYQYCPFFCTSLADNQANILTLYSIQESTP